MIAERNAKANKEIANQLHELAYFAQEAYDFWRRTK